MQPKVTLLSQSTNPLLSMATAARLCYYKGESFEDLVNLLKDDIPTQERLIKNCIHHRHMSVLEHSMFMFGIEGVSRNFTHQLVRHRNTSYEQQSLHYLTAEDCQVAEPTFITLTQKQMVEDCAAHSFEVYTKLLESGMPKEEARHILPSGIETKIVATANLRQWMHFIRLRMCNVNCEEIRLVANQIRIKIIEILPIMYDYLGPNCYTCSSCIEGTRFCCKPMKLPLVVREGPVVLATLHNTEEVKKYEESKQK